jgi:hypothetical protein
MILSWKPIFILEAHREIMTQTKKKRKKSLRPFSTCLVCWDVDGGLGLVNRTIMASLDED